MGIDPRGPRFGALVTTVVLAVVLVTGSGWLLAAQAVVFTAGAVFGLRYAPYGLLYRGLIRPPPGAAPRARARGPAAVRPSSRRGFRDCGRSRLRHGRDLAGRGGDGGRAGRGVPERGLRVLSRVRDVPAPSDVSGRAARRWRRPELTRRSDEHDDYR